MAEFSITRDDALVILEETTKTPSLIKHGRVVEAAMYHFAKKFGEDENKWRIIGMLHDVDYELYPDQHCYKTPQILGEKNFPNDWISSIQSHGWEVMGDDLPKPKHIMEKVLYTVDQLTGLIMAVIVMRPSKSVMDLKVSSVNKKFKDKRFAAKVDREVIKRGASMLGMELSEVISDTIEALKVSAEDLGIKGTV